MGRNNGRGGPPLFTKLLDGKGEKKNNVTLITLD